MHVAHEHGGVQHHKGQESAKVLGHEDGVEADDGDGGCGGSGCTIASSVQFKMLCVKKGIARVLGHEDGVEADDGDGGCRVSRCTIEQGAHFSKMHNSAKCTIQQSAQFKMC